MLHKMIVICLALLLIGCGASDGSAVGGVSQREADELNAAAAMLDQPAAAATIATPAPAPPKK